MKLVTNKDIKLMNELYLQYKTYAAVARETGFSPSTVKKYIKKDYVSEKDLPIKKFEGILPPFDPSIFRGDDWGALCILSNEEISEVRELWKELEL